MQKIILLVVSVALASCACLDIHKKGLTGCDHWSGWCNEIREVANHSWVYAELSYDVYRDDGRYKLPSQFVFVRDYVYPKIDFFASIYKSDDLKVLAVVFRGTDSPKDMIAGNNPYLQLQNEKGIDVFDEAVREYPDYLHVVAGHSLGGGIATHISLNRDKLVSYSFNGSPVFHKKSGEPDNERYSIVEYGEVLKLLRVFGREASQLYTSIGCSDGNSFKQHSMELLATCLAQIAAIETTDAQDFLGLNKVDLEYVHDH